MTAPLPCYACGQIAAPCAAVALRSDWERTGQHLLSALSQELGDLDDETAIHILEAIAALDDADWTGVWGVEVSERRSDAPKTVEAGSQE